MSRGAATAKRLRSMARSDPGILRIRLGQELSQRWHYATGGWSRIDRKARHSTRHAAGLADVIVCNDDSIERLELFASDPAAVSMATMTIENALSRGLVAVFGGLLRLPNSASGWQEDTRFGQIWSERSSNRYDFYQPFERPVPYDVKHPWELSRLGLFPRLLAAAVVAGETHRVSVFLSALIDRWDIENPIGVGINWQPMEASVRAINLVIGAELACLVGEFELATKLDTVSVICGEYISRATEISPLSGNHFAANVAALGLLGSRFSGLYSPAKRWLEFSAEHSDRQILQQFNADGLHHEGSTAYHRFVVELFLVGNLALAHAGRGQGGEAAARLRTATLAAADLMRPDGTELAFGDADDATALDLDDRFSAPSVAPLVDLASRLWPCGITSRYKDPIPRFSSAVLARHCRDTIGTGRSSVSLSHYEETGLVVAASEHGEFFAIDVGDVGQSGRGGHGHNDVLSYEWWFSGRPVVVDPGTYSYTASRTLRDRFRSTSSHNSVSIDGSEVAELLGVGAIADSARTVRSTAGRSDIGDVTVKAGHVGYMATDPSIFVSRSLSLLDELRSIEVSDELIGATTETAIEQSLHLSAVVVLVDTGSNSARFEVDGLVLDLSWEWNADLIAEPFAFSKVYGSSSEATVLRLRGNYPGGAARYVLSIVGGPAASDPNRADAS